MLAFGLLAYWTRNHNREEYFLNKAVTEKPRDLQAWLDLASHYDYEVDRLAGEEGDEDHAAPNPTPKYSEALRSFNRAADLALTNMESKAIRQEQRPEIMGSHRIRNS